MTTAMTPELLAEILAEQPRYAEGPARVACDETGAPLVRAAGHVPVTTPLRELPEGSVDAVVLLGDEVSRHGDRADEFVACAADAAVPGGLVVLTAFAADGTTRPQERGVPADRESPMPRTEPRRFTAADVDHLLLHRGVGVRRLERRGDRWLVAGVTPVGGAERQARFVASLPFKLVTAAVVCTDAEDRVLCVYDAFKHHWTIPGGVVDAGEDPRGGAVREAYEESGVRVRAGDLAGVFNAAAPDRLLLVYAATPVDPDAESTRSPRTRQPNEVGEVAWLPRDEAFARLAPRSAWHVRMSLDHPGETWRE
jgi:ADP-ribose pyrophosphatase YjhB (NUDIX family)